MQRRMSAEAAHIRDSRALDALRTEISAYLRDFWRVYVLMAPGGLAQMLKTRDLLLTQAAVLSAMALSAQSWGSRGSALVLDDTGTAPAKGLEAYRCRPASGAGTDQTIETVWQDGGVSSSFSPVRPIPERDLWFENVWRDYRTRTAGLTR